MYTSAKVRTYGDAQGSRGLALVAAPWSHRRLCSPALHGSKWVDAARPIDIIHDNRHPTPGLQIWGDRLASDEIEVIDVFKSRLRLARPSTLPAGIR